MQDDDTSNPAMLWVLDGEALWNTKAGASGKSCADCHGDAKTEHEGRRGALSGVRRQHGPADRIWSSASICAAASRPEGAAASLREPGNAGASAYVASSRAACPSRRTTIRGSNLIEKGREAFNQRQGQLNLSCAQCHDDNWGKHLAGNTVPQAHPTGYPIYRLEWQSLGSLQRRLRNCMIGMRAESYAYGAPEYVDMELYLMWRARGMKMETPAVRP